MGICQPWHSLQQDPSALRLNVTAGWSGLVLPLTPLTTGRRNELLPFCTTSGDKVGWSGFARGKWVPGCNWLGLERYHEIFSK